MNALYNLARMTTATTGTGTLTLVAAVPGWLTFAQAGVPDGAVLTISIIDNNGGKEIRQSTYTLSGLTLTRAGAPYRSTGAGNNTNISLSGSAEVFITAAAEDLSSLLVAGGALTGTTLSLSQNASALLVGGTTSVLVGGVAQSVQVIGSNGGGIVRFSATTNAPTLRFGKSRGTVSVAAAVVAGDRLLEIPAYGDDGSTNGDITVNSAIIRAQAFGTVSVGIVPTFISMHTMNAAGVLAERIRLGAEGGLAIGIVTDPGASNLLVAGTAQINGAATISGAATFAGNTNIDVGGFIGVGGVANAQVDMRQTAMSGLINVNGVGGLRFRASTITDSVTAAGTINEASSHFFAAQTLATAGNVITVTQAESMLISAPAAGANITIGTALSLRTTAGIRSDGDIYFSGITAAFPKWHRSTTTIQALLGDSSGYASVDALAFLDAGAAPTGTAGSGYVRKTSPDITTPNIIGTATNNNAAAGSVGEYASASATAVALTSPNVINITSISLTAGDWDVEGTIKFNFAATTTSTVRAAGVTQTTGTMPTTLADSTAWVRDTGAITAGQAPYVMNTGTTRMSLSGTTTIFLVGGATFATSTCTADGFIRARRVR